MKTTLLFEYLQIGFGILLASIGLKAFLLPNHFLDGGVTGIAILLKETFGGYVSSYLLIISLPFLALGWFSVSRKIILKSIFAIILLSIIIYFENFDSITEDKLLIAIFGGLFLGAGIGIAIKNGCVLDGSELLGIYCHERFGLSIGNVILLFNSILFSFTALLLSVEVAMYSILTYLITAKVIDWIIKGFEDYIGLMIVSKLSGNITEVIERELKSGYTVYKGEKGLGGQGIESNFDIIHLVINRIELKKTLKKIEHKDPDAFIVEFDVNSVKGGLKTRFPLIKLK